jgi:uncharacterized protein
MSRIHSNERFPTFLLRLCSGAARGAVVAFLRLYKLAISPWLPPACRFYPTCSEYAVEVFHTHSLRRAAWLTVRRLAKCGPWHPGGFDPAPPGRP